ncbi:hypothetical protein, partial [Acidithiobacillus sp.]
MDRSLSLGTPPRAGAARAFSPIYGAADSWLAAQMARQWQRPLLILLPNARDVEEWQREWRFFA